MLLTKTILSIFHTVQNTGIEKQIKLAKNNQIFMIDNYQKRIYAHEFLYCQNSKNYHLILLPRKEIVFITQASWNSYN